MAVAQIPRIALYGIKAMEKIGLLGGSFDPIHFGHLNLAFELMEKRRLDQVWFIPAQVNPLKRNFPPIAIDHRLKMVKLAIEGIPQFKLITLERERPPPSYMIDTLRTLFEEENDASTDRQFYLLLGEDALTDFFLWRSPEEIIQLAPLLIGSRCGTREQSRSNSPPFFQEVIKKAITPTRLMDI